MTHDSNVCGPTATATTVPLACTNESQHGAKNGLVISNPGEKNNNASTTLDLNGFATLPTPVARRKKKHFEATTTPISKSSKKIIPPPPTPVVKDWSSSSSEDEMSNTPLIQRKKVAPKRIKETKADRDVLDEMEYPKASTSAPLRREMERNKKSEADRLSKKEINTPTNSSTQSTPLSMSRSRRIPLLIPLELPKKVKKIKSQTEPEQEESKTKRHIKKARKEIVEEEKETVNQVEVPPTESVAEHKRPYKKARKEIVEKEAVNKVEVPPTESVAEPKRPYKKARKEIVEEEKETVNQVEVPPTESVAEPKRPKKKSCNEIVEEEKGTVNGNGNHLPSESHLQNIEILSVEPFQKVKKTTNGKKSKAVKKVSPNKSESDEFQKSPTVSSNYVLRKSFREKKLRFGDDWIY